jgi:hypothetical protein
VKVKIEHMNIYIPTVLISNNVGKFMVGQCSPVIMTGFPGPNSGIGAFHPFWHLRKLWHPVKIRCHQTVQYFEIQEIFRGHAILHTLEAIIIKLHEPCPTIYGPADQTESPFTIVQIDGVEFCERENTQKNRQQDPHSFEHITSHPLGMGIYSISAIIPHTILYPMV